MGDRSGRQQVALNRAGAFKENGRGVELS